MMLRRTKADQVRKVYDRLFHRYADSQAIAKAHEKELESILYPLGLRWRTPAFQRVAIEIEERHEAGVPKTREELRTLTGVGDYVAGAVLSIAFGKKEWMVDSNIVRLFRRYFGIETSKEGRRDKHVLQMARMYVSGQNPRNANLAILDFTALVCTPHKPKHDECPLKKKCHYLAGEYHHDIPSVNKLEFSSYNEE